MLPSDSFSRLRRKIPLLLLWLTACVSLFLGLGGYQLGLPGLHYDEAKEAGVNAMQLLSGAPVTAFREATIPLFGQALPLMVQDYIGALNVYLAVPFLALTGIGVPNLRLLPLVLAVLAMLCLERAISEWIWLRHGPHPAHAPFSTAALWTLTLLAVSPSFVFWNRQGIFVTNATLPATFFALWQLLRWRRTGRASALIMAGLGAGIALYAKLLAIWVILPLALLFLGAWLWQRRKHEHFPWPPLTPALLLLLIMAAALPLIPLLLFNLQSGGTLASINHNLSQSYYGVDNRAVWADLPVRLAQFGEILRGGQFWYLGGVHANSAAPLLWIAAVGWGLGRPAGRQRLGLPLLLLGMALGLSLFTVSDLFITHYALIQPLALAVAGIALSACITGTPAECLRQRRYPALLCLFVLLTWTGLDLATTLAYHRDLSRSGGLADHSDASYHLAYHLRYNGLGAPIVLDWGMEATVRYLSEGTVTPIEIFGYDSLAQPDANFALRLVPFLENPDNVYMLRAPAQTVFAGRRAVFLEQVQRLGRVAVLEQSFPQRDGVPLYELWRVHSPHQE